MWENKPTNQPTKKKQQIDRFLSFASPEIDLIEKLYFESCPGNNSDT